MKFVSIAIVVFAVLMQKLPCNAHVIDQADTNTVIRLNKQAWEAAGNDLELSLKYAREAAGISQKLNYQKGLSYSYNIYGNYHKTKGSYDSAYFYYRKSLEIRQKIGDPVDIARSLRNIMAAEKRLNKYDQAIQTGLKGLAVLKPHLNNASALAEKAWLEVNLADIYDKQGNSEQAILLIHDAKKIFSDLENEAGMAAASVNLGNIYETQERYNKALEEYNTAREIFIRQDNQQELAKAYNNIGNIYYSQRNYDKARSFYLGSLKLKQEEGFTDEIRVTRMNLAIIYETAGKLDSAELLYKQVIDESVKNRDTILEFETRWNIGTLFKNQERYKEALHELLAAFHLFRSQAITSQNIRLFRDMARTYSALQKPDSALFFSDKYNAIVDSIKDLESNNMRLQSANNEKQSELKYTQEKASHLITLSIGLSIVIFCILIIFFLYRRFAESRKKMLELKEEVKDKEIAALDAMMEGQQEERKRLATELHDTIGSMLSATKYSFKAMEKSMEKMMEENKNQYHKINTMLDETMDSVRKISHDMASGIFTEKGLEGALSELCQTFEQPGKMQIHLNVYGFDSPLEYNTEFNLYRIVQELLTNIIKHANAGEITIQLIKSNENINLTVEDDGVGFDEGEARRKKGLGLSNIDLRVEKLAGRWNIDSGKGRGTTIIIDIPVTKFNQV